MIRKNLRSRQVAKYHQNNSTLFNQPSTAVDLSHLESLPLQISLTSKYLNYHLQCSTPLPPPKQAQVSVTSTFPQHLNNHPLPPQQKPNEQFRAISTSTSNLKENTRTDNHFGCIRSRRSSCKVSNGGNGALKKGHRRVSSYEDNDNDNDKENHTHREVGALKAAQYPKKPYSYLEAVEQEEQEQEKEKESPRVEYRPQHQYQQQLSERSDESLLVTAKSKVEGQLGRRRVLSEIETNYKSNRAHLDTMDFSKIKPKEHSVFDITDRGIIKTSIYDFCNTEQTLETSHHFNTSITQPLTTQPLNTHFGNTQPFNKQALNTLSSTQAFNSTQMVKGDNCWQRRADIEKYYTRVRDRSTLEKLQRISEFSDRINSKITTIITTIETDKKL